MSAYGVITLMSLNNWFCPLEEFPQITGCQEHGQGNRNYARCCFWGARLSLSWLWREWVGLLFCLSPFLSCPFLKGYIWFYFPEKGLADVFMQKAQILEILLLAVTFACQSRNSFPCSESGKSVAFCECS